MLQVSLDSVPEPRRCDAASVTATTTDAFAPSLATVHLHPGPCPIGTDAHDTWIGHAGCGDNLSAVPQHWHPRRCAQLLYPSDSVWHSMVKARSMEIVLLLGLGYGVDVDAVNGGALRHAVEDGNADMVALIYQSPPHSTIPTPTHEKSASHKLRSPHLRYDRPYRTRLDSSDPTIDTKQQRAVQACSGGRISSLSLFPRPELPPALLLRPVTPSSSIDPLPNSPRSSISSNSSLPPSNRNSLLSSRAPLYTNMGTSSNIYPISCNAFRWAELRRHTAAASAV